MGESSEVWLSVGIVQPPNVTASPDILFDWGYTREGWARTQASCSSECRDRRSYSYIKADTEVTYECVGSSVRSVRSSY